MDIPLLQSKAQQVMQKYCESKTISLNQQTVFFKLVEEVGELSSAMEGLHAVPTSITPKRMQELQANIANQCADVVGNALALSSICGVDLKAALEKKWFVHLDGNGQ